MDWGIFSRHQCIEKASHTMTTHLVLNAISEPRQKTSSSTPRPGIEAIMEHYRVNALLVDS